jgi:hypothetical protein
MIFRLRGGDDDTDANDGGDDADANDGGDDADANDGGDDANDGGGKAIDAVKGVSRFIWWSMIVLREISYICRSIS